MRNLSKWDFYAQLKTEFIRSTLHHNLENKRFKSLALVVYFVSMFSLLPQAQPANAQAGARDRVPLLISQRTSIQEAEEKEILQPIRMGERLPNSFWEREHLFYLKGDTVRKSLAEYRGKIIIFDFWATWCGACINKMPELREIEKKLSDKIKIILVNKRGSRDNYEKIDRFFDERTSLPAETIFDDHFLKEIFPHKYQPFYVWIDKLGEVSAYTYSPFLNHEQIEKFIESKE
ncbi:TlpA family protein disulfide reductase [Sphingobacterium multivorum]|uniref:TlpA family protein disulfide reductase n=1 Tax=Sphingobacterium multivorum TaxID=28454 RepID=UPI003DA5395B